VQYGVELNPRGRPPEVLSGARLTAAVDCWHLGCTFFDILTAGQPQQPGGAGGRVPLSSLMRALASSPRRALEARHLLASQLSAQPSQRPTAAQALAHPLFWSAPAALRAAKNLFDAGGDADEKLSAAAAGDLGGGCAAAAELRTLLAATECDLQGWQSRVSPAMGDRLAHGGYSDGFSGLLRFARNALEHPPTTAEERRIRAALAEGGVEGGGGARGVEARRRALAEYLVLLFPSLALACAACGAAPGEEAVQRAQKARRRRAGAAEES